MKVENVEDLIEVLSGMVEAPKVELEDVDKTIVYSIGRQIIRGKALTDRQLNVMLDKLGYYRSKIEFISEEDWNKSLENLRMPLREIDRSKTVTVVSTLEDLPVGLLKQIKNTKSECPWIKIRFPFSKKTIMDLQDTLLPKFPKEYYHERGSHEWYFKLTENSVLEVINLFKNKEFEIEQDLLDSHKIIKEMSITPENYLPGIYEGKVKNLPENALKYLENDIGPLSQDNIVLYRDRAIMFGLYHFGEELRPQLNKVSVLASKIAQRKYPNVFISTKKYSLNDVAYALNELERFPLAVVVPEKNALDIIDSVYKTTRNIIPAEQQTVLFRLDNKVNFTFNQYIKENNLNNSLANNPKIVYINENKKIPKPLLESGLEFKCTLYFGGYVFARQHLDVDLAIHYDEVQSPHSKYGLDELRNSRFGLERNKRMAEEL